MSLPFRTNDVSLQVIKVGKTAKMPLKMVGKVTIQRIL